ncbi:MAG TPA: hypothetical protein VF699_00060 [Caulobacteraceae bacterium]|jgi:hypothetical protein
MLVYGDIVRPCAPVDLVAEMHVAIVRAEAAAGLNRHAALVSALIAAGELLQAVADAEFVESGRDAPSPAQDAITALASDLAHLVRASWLSLSSAHPRAGGDPGVFDPDDQAAEKGWAPAFAGVSGKLELLATLPLPERLQVKQPEGYAFYALYPEAYVEAAAALPPGSDWRVLGLRSIGTSLAAAVAAALEAPPPLTARPSGHPFARTLELAPELAASVGFGQRFAVVDEGPGLSGSSFGVALDLLEAQGAPRDRLHVFPGHGGDLGPQASDAHRARWSAVSRHVVSFDALLLESGRLQFWAKDLVGPVIAPLEDLSGGGWRALAFPGATDLPPSNAAQERRKFLLRTADGAWLLKFAGLGRIGERKLERARALHAAGFTPEPAGLVHGFLVERWIEPATRAPPIPVDHLARYLRFRRDRFPAEPGASAAELFEMARVNTTEALGEGAAAALDRFRRRLHEFAVATRPVEVDARLHPWEWLAAPDGLLLKTDALDHHAAHDLVGAQDIAWDVAGAVVELGLDSEDAERLRAHLDTPPDQVAFMTVAYCAFQLGYWSMAADAHAGWPEEAARLSTARNRYADRLRALLDA